MILKFIQDVGMDYPTEKSTTMRRMYLVQCSDCKSEHRIQAGQFKAGYTNWCKTCGNKYKGRK